MDLPLCVPCFGVSLINCYSLWVVKRLGVGWQTVKAMYVVDLDIGSFWEVREDMAN